MADTAVAAVDVSAAPLTTKAERTRAAIIDAALQLFFERGYDDTTMRAIATQAGVSVGNAYYYFASKEHLVHGFYERLQRDHALAAGAACVGLTSLDDRIRAVLHAWLDEAAPLHAFLVSFVGHAADPRSPLSPFSAQSAGAREIAVQMWGEVVDGASIRGPKRLRAELPRLLWLAHLGVVLFWAFDTSPGQQRTRDLVDGSAPVVGRLVRLTSVPGVARAADDLARLVRSVTSSAPVPSPGEGPRSAER